MKKKYEDIFLGKFPPEEFEYHDSYTTLDQFNNLIEIIENNSTEKIIDKYLTDNPEILTTILHHFETGNHKGWVFPKLTLTPRIEYMFQKGMIPDFIVGGQSSDGQEWWLLELKGADEKIFNIDKNNRIKFSDTLNKGICQLIEYIDYSTEKQNKLRDEFGLKNFREPSGIILIGRDVEMNDIRKQKLKSYWNRLHKGKLEIRTYDFLIREFKYALQRKNSFS